MFQSSKMWWVVSAVVMLFGVGCGGAAGAPEAGALTSTSVQALAGCSDNPAFDVHGVYLATGQFPAAMACADFNGDGQADLAVASPGSGTVGVFLGQEEGTLAAQVSFPVEGGSAVVARDVDADGWVDLEVMNAEDGSVSLLWGHGPGGFAPVTASER